MKRLFLLFAAFMVFAVAIEAQFVKVGGGLSYGTGVYFREQDHTFQDISHKTSNPALTFKSIYRITLPLQISPSASIFMPRVTRWDDFHDDRQILSAFMFDINAHYVVNSLNQFEFYGLAGGNMTILRMKWKYEGFEGEGDYSDSSSEAIPGLNLGIGTYMQVTPQIDIFGEFKYIVGKRNQFMLTAGVLLNVDWLKRHETPDF